MLEPVAEASYDTFLVRARTRRVSRKAAEVGVLRTDQGADHGDEGVQVTFAMPCRAQVMEQVHLCQV